MKPRLQNTWKDKKKDTSGKTHFLLCVQEAYLVKQWDICRPVIMTNSPPNIFTAASSSLLMWQNWEWSCRLLHYCVCLCYDKVLPSISWRCHNGGTDGSLTPLLIEWPHPSGRYSFCPLIGQRSIPRAVNLFITCFPVIFQWVFE